MGKMIDIVTEMVENDGKITSLTNDQLANELLEKVWAKLDISSLDAALIGEAIARLANLPDAPGGEMKGEEDETA